MGRALTDRERDVLLFMIDSASPFADDPPLTHEAREDVRRQVTTARAGRRCDCGTCPSIEIENAQGHTPTTGERVVLSAEAPDASLLLFIDGGQLSYLELASHADNAVNDFPPVSTLNLDNSP